MAGVLKNIDQISLVPKLELGPELLGALTARIFASEHETDTGPRTVWHHPGYQDKFYAILLTEPRVAIGTIYVAGTSDHTDVAWWIDSLYRGKGYGRAAVEVLAAMLKVQGVRRIGPLPIMGDYEASRRLAKQLKSHFE